MPNVYLFDVLSLLPFFAFPECCCLGMQVVVEHTNNEIMIVQKCSFLIYCISPKVSRFQKSTVKTKSLEYCLQAFPHPAFFWSLLALFCQWVSEEVPTWAESIRLRGMTSQSLPSPTEFFQRGRGLIENLVVLYHCWEIDLFCNISTTHTHTHNILIQLGLSLLLLHTAKCIDK